MIERFPSPPSEWLAVLNVERQHLARLADRMVGHQSRVEDVEADLRGRLVEQPDAALAGIIGDLGFDPNSDVVRRIVALHLRRATGAAPTPAPSAESSPRPVSPPPIPADF
ncbi:hypothetical protein ACI8AC_24155 [Geodermatophilus sp. SYSU D00758]